MLRLFFTLMVLGTCACRNSFAQAITPCRVGKPEENTATKQLEEFTKQFADSIGRMQSQTNARSAGIKYTIPVVFHVFGTDFEGKRVTPEIIRNSLNQVNDDFNGRNDDYSAIDPLFDPIKSTMDIEFKLAQIDPSGKPTTGMIFYPNTQGVKGFGEKTAHDAEIQKYAWDNYKYCNVYIMLKLYDTDDTSQSGVAWYPTSFEMSSNLFRIVYNGKFLTGNTDKEFSSTLSHEFGHYLNLFHTFEGLCTAKNDEVDDTPAENEMEASACRGIKNCFGNFINGENYMGYTGSKNRCYKMFTKGQVIRMLAALQYPTRKQLWQAANLVATGVAGSRVNFVSLEFNEHVLNDGTIDEPIDLLASESVTFSTVSQFLEPSVDFIVNNLPAGLTARIQIINSQQAKFYLAGIATSHRQSNSITNLSIEFKPSAFATGFSGLSNPIITDIKVNWIDPYTAISCVPSVSDNNFIRITRFRLNTTDKSSLQERYSNNTVSITSLAQGCSYPLTINVNTAGAPLEYQIIKVWVDWNGNYVLTEDEIVISKVFESNPFKKEKEFTFTLRVPFYAFAGKKSIRILAQSKGSTENWLPCGDFSKGEIEDYYANVVEYCVPNKTSEQGAFISNVSLQDINNSTQAGSYTNYLDDNLVATVAQGTKSTLSATISKGNAAWNDNQRVQAWIDWNLDGVFSDSELIVTKNFAFTEAAGQTTYLVNEVLTIPANVVIGSTTFLRIINQSIATTATNSACSAIADGEIEDYGIKVDAPITEVEATIETINVYPNPSVDGEYHTSQPVIILSIIHQSGVELEKTSLIETRSINLTGQPPGVYLVKAANQNHSITFKIIKQE